MGATVCVAIPATVSVTRSTTETDSVVDSCTPIVAITVASGGAVYIMVVTTAPTTLGIN